MSPDIKLKTCSLKDCGGISVSVPSGSVYGGTVSFCLKCMEDKISRQKYEIEQLEGMRERPSQERLDTLARHYSNEKLHNIKLRNALEKIAEAAKEDGVHLLAAFCEDTARAALKAVPPNPLKDFYKDGYHTGHPYPEYLNLPMRDTDEYQQDP